MNRVDPGANEKRQVDLLSERIIGCALTVHRALGPGLLESAYQTCLAHELSLAGLRVATERMLPIHYRDVAIDAGYRPDIVVEDCVLVELKAVERLLPIHEAQVLTYLKLSGIKLGLLINFNVRLLKTGIRRLVL